jgi:hypothetical protein
VFLIFYVLPLLPFAALYVLFCRFSPLRVDTAALARRLWRIIAAVVIVIALNYLALGLERISRS